MRKLGFDLKGRKIRLQKLLSTFLDILIYLCETLGSLIMAKRHSFSLKGRKIHPYLLVKVACCVLRV